MANKKSPEGATGGSLVPGRTCPDISAQPRVETLVYFQRHAVFSIGQEATRFAPEGERDCVATLHKAATHHETAPPSLLGQARKTLNLRQELRDRPSSRRLHRHSEPALERRP